VVGEISFIGKVLPNFNLGNMISTTQRIFHEENDPNMPNFNENQFQIAIICNKFQ
jgi:hypothetical protein